MPACNNKNYLVVGQDDLSRWVEARALANATSIAVAKFIWEDIVCRHGCFGRLVVDRGLENKKHVIAFVKKYSIERVQISAYHQQANGMVERGHNPIVEALSRMTDGGVGNWVTNLPAVLLADRTTIHDPTGQTPFFMVYGREAVLPVELRYPTWRVLDWDNVKTRSDLIAVRAQQLRIRDEDMEEVVLRKRRKRMEGKERFDNSRQLRQTEISEGDTVLRHDAKLELDKSSAKKLAYKWMGPYRVRRAIPEKGTYELEEFDGTPIPGTHSGSRLKKFVKRKGFYETIDQSEEEEEEQEEQGDLASVDRTLRSGSRSQMEPMDFEIVLPQLTPEQRREYIRFEEDDEGNIL